MKKHTRILALLLALAMLLLCSCGAEKAEKPSEPAEPAETAPDAVEETDGKEETPEESEAENAADFICTDNGDGTVTLTGYTGSEEALTVPATIGGKAVTAIGESCFAGNIGLKKVHVPEGVTALGDYAFECCSVLEKVYLSDSLETVGSGAFSGCCSLYLLDMQDNVKTIGDGAFLECTELVSFIAPKALESVGAFAFANCTDLVKADFRNSALAAVSDRMFYACTNLATVRLPEGIEAVGVRAFSNNDAMMYIYLPDSVKSVGAYAFESCENLQNFSFPADEVAPGTFASCVNLMYVNFPETLKSIGAFAFSNTALDTAELEIPEGAAVNETAFGPLEETEVYEESYTPALEDILIAPKAADISVEELMNTAVEQGYTTVSNDEFMAWSDAYLAFNAENALLDQELNPYVTKYKGEIGYYYKAMTAVASGVASEIESAKENFGDDFEPMYRMIDHGLATEISRFRMENDMLLFTGVYDFQLSAITGKDEKPTLDELKTYIGSTFTDACLTSTTTEAQVAFGFSDTLFVIYAPAANVNALGAVSMDSYMHTFENEILLNSGATYEILDAGVLENSFTDYDGEVKTDTRDFVLLQLINE